MYTGCIYFTLYKSNTTSKVKNAVWYVAKSIKRIQLATAVIEGLNVKACRPMPGFPLHLEFTEAYLMEQGGLASAIYNEIWLCLNLDQAHVWPKIYEVVYG